MIINDISGNKIVETDHKTLRRALEHCVEKGICLDRADLRKASLHGASLDGLRAKGVCLWGADLTGADIGLADLSCADLRCATLKDCCLAETNLSDAHLEGAYFSSTLLEGALMERTKLSCPSFWSSDIFGVKSLQGAVFVHRGETEIALDRHPVIVRERSGTYIFTRKELVTEDRVFFDWHDVPAGVAETLCAIQSHISAFSK